jgi:hypothetical protein
VCSKPMFLGCTGVIVTCTAHGILLQAELGTGTLARVGTGRDWDVIIFPDQ